MSAGLPLCIQPQQASPLKYGSLYVAAEVKSGKIKFTMHSLLLVKLAALMTITSGDSDEHMNITLVGQ